MCDGCYRRHVDNEVNGKGQTTEIKCINVGCRKVLAYADVRRICLGDGATAKSREVFDRFDHLLMRRAVEAAPHFRWCSRANCGSGQDHLNAGRYPIMTCCKASCKAKTCFNHQVPWHEGMTCAQYDEAQRTATDAVAAEEWKRRNTKPCPRCRAPIEKNAGCCHMTCKNTSAGCTHEFCWHCCAPWQSGMLGRRGAHLHRTTCRMYQEKQ